MEVDDFIPRYVEHHGLTPHVRLLPRAREIEAEPTRVCAGRERLAVSVERAPVPGNGAVKASDRNPSGDINDGRVLVSIFRVPCAGLEIDLIHDCRIEELVETARDSSRHRHTVHVVRVLRVLAAYVNFTGWRARCARDGLLEYLRCGVARRAVILVLLEPLVTGSSIYSQGNRRRDRDCFQTYSYRCQLEIEADVSRAIGDTYRPRVGTKADESRGDCIVAGSQIVRCVSAEGIG